MKPPQLPNLACNPPHKVEEESINNALSLPFMPTRRHTVLTAAVRTVHHTVSPQLNHLTVRVP